MTIQSFSSGPFATNTYVVSCPHSQECAIIDAPPDSSSLLINYITANNLTPVKIILTHSHWDHIADVAVLKKHYGVPVIIHADDRENLENPGSDRLPCWIEIPSVKPDALLKEGDSIKVGDLNFVVIHTPGHSPGGICLYNAEQNILFSGDTLFKGTIGNISFPTSSSKSMWESLKKLSKLPKETRVYPGHGEMTTIGSESWLSNAENVFG